MDKSYLVITDSGGIQEEAPSLGKPVLVMRDVTERQEGIDAGTAILVGTDTKRIMENAQKLIDDPSAYEEMSKAINPYGNGTSAKQIVSILLNTD
jgi:UDP-N-acetylglucosamine 2-epimerase (non-hydrolysing)